MTEENKSKELPNLHELEKNEDYKFVSDFITKNGTVRKSKKNGVDEITSVKNQHYKELMEHFDVPSEVIDKIQKAEENIVGGSTVYLAKRFPEQFKEAVKKSIDPKTVRGEISFNSGSSGYEHITLKAHDTYNDPKNPKSNKISIYGPVSWTAKRKKRIPVMNINNDIEKMIKHSLKEGK